MADLGQIKLEEVLETIKDLYAREGPILLDSILGKLVSEHRKTKKKDSQNKTVGQPVCVRSDHQGEGHDWYLNTITGKMKCIYCGIFKP